MGVNSLLHNVELSDHTQVFGLGCEHPYLLSHLADPISGVFKWQYNQYSERQKSVLWAYQNHHGWLKGNLKDQSLKMSFGNNLTIELNYIFVFSFSYVHMIFS